MIASPASTTPIRKKSAVAKFPSGEIITELELWRQEWTPRRAETICSSAD
jgi:hypothetical protein